MWYKYLIRVSLIQNTEIVKIHTVALCYLLHFYDMIWYGIRMLWYAISML